MLPLVLAVVIKMFLKILSAAKVSFHLRYSSAKLLFLLFRGGPMGCRGHVSPVFSRIVVLFRSNSSRKGLRRWDVPSKIQFIATTSHCCLHSIVPFGSMIYCTLY